MPESITSLLTSEEPIEKRETETTGLHEAVMAERDELQEQFQSEVSKYNEVFGTAGGILEITGARQSMLEQSYTGNVDPALTTRIWTRLQEETDIPKAWESIDAGIASSVSGILLGTKDEMNNHLDTKIGNPSSILDHLLKTLGTENPDNHYSAFSRKVILQDEKILHDLFLQVTEGNTNIPAMSLLAHELTHDSNASLMSVRTGSYRTIRTGKAIWANISKGKHDREDFRIRATTEELVLHGTQWDEFVQETLCDISGIETGTRVYKENYTTERLKDNRYYSDSAHLPEDQKAVIEKKLHMLSYLGLRAPLAGIGINNTVIEEFREHRLSHGDSDANDFYTFEYLGQLLDSTISWQLNKKYGVQGVPSEEEGEQILENMELESKLRNLRLRKITAEELIAYTQKERGEDLIYTAEDDVMRREFPGKVVLTSIYGKSIPGTNKAIRIELCTLKGSDTEYLDLEVREFKFEKNDDGIARGHLYRKMQESEFESEGLNLDEIAEKVVQQVVNSATVPLAVDGERVKADAIPGRNSALTSSFIEKLRHVNLSP